MGDRTQQRYDALYLAAFRNYHELSLLGHAFWILASHGVSEGGPFPLVCAACQKLWRCPEIVWAADWILKAKRRGLLDQFDLELGDDVLALLASWGSDVAVPVVAAYANG